MALGASISSYRKMMGLTQEELAMELGVTNQAVSKWESEQCCPDIMLLPKIAQVFGVSLDTLFGIKSIEEEKSELPWADDDALRIVLFRGRRLVEEKRAAEKIEIQWNGPALNVQSSFSIACAQVQGNVDARCDVTCKDVMGSVHAGCDVTCGQVNGNVTARCDVNCADVQGNVHAGCDVSCCGVMGDIQAGCDIRSGA